MRFSIVAEDKSAQKSFSYQLELDTDTIIKVTGLVCSTVAMVTLLSLFKDQIKTSISKKGNRGF